MDVLPASVSVHHTYATASEARRGHQIRWRLLATVWVLGIEPGCSGRVVSVLQLLNHLSIPQNFILKREILQVKVYMKVSVFIPAFSLVGFSDYLKNNLQTKGFVKTKCDKTELISSFRFMLHIKKYAVASVHMKVFVLLMRVGAQLSSLENLIHMN